MKWLLLWVYILNKYTCIRRVCLFFLQKGFLSLDVRLCRKERQKLLGGGGRVRSSQDFHVKDAPRLPPPFQNLSLFYRLPCWAARDVWGNVKLKDGPVQVQASFLLYLSLTTYNVSSLYTHSEMPFKHWMVDRNICTTSKVNISIL
jgi:hypothetical protein